MLCVFRISHRGQYIDIRLQGYMLYWQLNEPHLPGKVQASAISARGREVAGTKSRLGSEQWNGNSGIKIIPECAVELV